MISLLLLAVVVSRPRTRNATGTDAPSDQPVCSLFHSTCSQVEEELPLPEVTRFPASQTEGEVAGGRSSIGVCTCSERPAHLTGHPVHRERRAAPEPAIAQPPAPPAPATIAPPTGKSKTSRMRLFRLAISCGIA